MALLRFLIVAISVLYIARFVFRMLLPMLFTSLVNKMQENVNTTSSTNPKKQGEVYIDYVPPHHDEEKPSAKRHQRNQDGGEFVDYEEVK